LGRLTIIAEFMIGAVIKKITNKTSMISTIGVMWLSDNRACKTSL
jgi:hypothetical protein